MSAFPLIATEPQTSWHVSNVPPRTRPKIGMRDFFVRDPAAVRLAPHFVNVKSRTAEVGEPRHAQGRFGCRVNPPLQPHLSFLNRWMDSLFFRFWDRFDQQRERLA